MEQYLFVYGKECSVCHFLEKYVEERAKGTGISYDKKEHTECWYDIEIIPTIIHTKDWVELERFEWQEEIISLIKG